jgi:diacylglycerol kinase
MRDLAMTMPNDLPPDESPLARKAAFGQTAKAVAWSFFGIRRSVDHEQDVRRLNPLHVVIAAVLGAALFVLALVVLVHLVVGAASSH